MRGWQGAHVHESLLEGHHPVGPGRLGRGLEHRRDADRRHDLRRGDVVAVDHKELREEVQVRQLIAVERALLRGLDLLLCHHVRPRRTERRQVQLQTPRLMASAVAKGSHAVNGVDRGSVHGAGCARIGGLQRAQTAACTFANRLGLQRKHGAGVYSHVPAAF